MKSIEMITSDQREEREDANENVKIIFSDNFWDAESNRIESL